MHHVFLYGTLKVGEPNCELMTDSRGVAKLLGKGKTTQKWPLVIGSKYNIPYILYHQGYGHHVVGEIYSIDETKLASLDELECHPTYYVREQEEVEWLDSSREPSRITCWIYFLKAFKPTMLSLPFLEEWSSAGSHKLPYVPSDDITDPNEI